MKIICIGRNYVEHAKELNNAVPGEPVFFLKPETALIHKNQPFYLPDFSNDVHYETELVLKINRLGKHIDVKYASRYYDEIGIGIDFTARDIQNDLKKAGLPWEKAKAFDGSAPLGLFLPKSKFADVNNIHFSMKLNSVVVQQGNTQDLIFSFDFIIAHVSKFFTLKIGDLIFTGTPAGVGPVKIGDRIQADIEGEELLNFVIK